MAQLLLPGNAIKADVLAGKYFSAGSIYNEAGTMTNNAASNIQALLFSNVPISGGYYNGAGEVLYPVIGAGDNELRAANISRSTVNLNYELLKSIQVKFPAQYRIRFALRSEEEFTTVYGRIYKNGAGFGTERSTTSTSLVYYTEALSFTTNDYVQIYAKTSNVNFFAGIEYFSVRSELAIPVTITN